eukprot:5313614-Pyramimonas_sp.AAC.1
MKLIDEHNVFRGEFVNIPPEEIGYCPWNRSSSDPNMQYVHKDLNANFKKGYDPLRAKPGVVVRVRKEDNPKLWQEWVNYNKQLARNSTLYPPVNEEKMCYFTLASSHHTLLIRLYQARIISTLTGERFQVENDEKLTRVITAGHKYIVLDHTCPKEECEKLSEWMNADNNSSLAKSEVEHIKHCKSVIETHFPNDAQVEWALQL